MMRHPTLLVIFVASLLLSTNIRAESWPTLDHYAKDCVLIVRIKQVGDFSSKNYAPLELKVLETWAGTFKIEDFEESKEGHIVAHYGQHGMTLTEGQEAIVFYTRHNQPPDKLVNHSTAFPITAEKIVYAATANEPEGRQEMTVAEFRRRIDAARK